MQKSFAAAVMGAGVLLGAVAHAPASAQDQANGRVILMMSGDRAWKVECVFQKDDGSQSKPNAKGRGGASTGAISAFDVVSGSCDIAAGNKGVLKVRLDERSSAFACPFGAMAEGAACEKIYAAEAKETISIKLK